MARELTDSEKALAKEILDKVYDSTMEKEVGMHWVLHQLAKEYGVKLKKELKRYGGTNKPV
jgi:hypothetical protein